MKNEIFCIILDYCGGVRTNILYKKLTKWNPGFKIHVLDNASPENKCDFITHQNKINSGVGGGIRDCIKLAREYGSKYVMFIANDIVPVTKIDIGHLMEIMEFNDDVVQISASLTKNSDKKYYPWMTNMDNGDNRLVHHADLLCSILDLDFIESFGGFPESKSGWGYDWEIGYQAKIKNKKIVISDLYRIKHVNDIKNNSSETWNIKLQELKRVYNKRYGNFNVIKPFFDLDSIS
ncbi:hypothetical protein [Algibacter sp. 2305UL17-15]|uniref:hypothetical protein n=1 Tax=Algibacter sp. 2305UL17-15 TaxID=3231268 RepID=UPI0034591630